MRLTQVTLLFAALAFGFGTTTPLKAQDEATTDSTDQVNSADTGETTATADEAESWERLIYLPYKDLWGVFEKHGSTVFLPYLEYLKLWEQAHGDKPGGDKPPVDAVITESEYQAVVDGDLARIDAVLKVQVLGDAWAEVPVQFGEAAVGKVSSDQGTVLLKGTGKGTYSLLFSETGEHVVNLELVARVHTSPDGRSFQLKCPNVGITTFELSIPAADQTVKVTPELVSLPVDADEGETRIKANLGSTGQIAASWHPRLSAKPQMDLLASVTNHLVIAIQDGLVHTDAALHFDVLRGEMSEVRIAVPTDHQILGVESPDVQIKGWKAAENPNRQVVTVEFLSPVEKPITILVHTERSAPSDPFEIAGLADDGTAQGIHALDAIRESGQVILTHGSDLNLSIEQQQGLMRIEAAEVPEQFRRGGSLNFKFYSPQFRLQVAVRPLLPRITVNHNSRFVFHDDELRLEDQLQYQVERAGIFQLQIQFPEGLVLDQVNGSSVKEHTFDDDSRVLTISLAQQQMGTIDISITAHLAFNTNLRETSLTLPVIEPLKVDREVGRLQVYAPDAIEVITDETAVIAAQPDPTAQAANVPNARLASSWTYNRRPITIPVNTTRKPTRLTATVGTAVHIKAGTAEIKSLLNYTVQYAGVDTFRFSVPEAIADSIRIESLAQAPAPAIKQKSRADEAVDGWVTWTVVMQRDVVGNQPFEIAYDIELSADDADDTTADDADSTADTDGPALEEFLVQPLQVLGIEEDNAQPAVELAYVAGEIVVDKEQALTVSADATQEELEAIDVRELKYLPQQGTLAYRYFEQPVELTVSSIRHEIQEVVETIISRALVEIVIGRDQSAAYRCRYMLKSSERQRLRIDWPEGAQLLGVWVDRTQVSPEQDENPTTEGYESFFINVARAKSSDEPFHLTLQYRINLARGFEGFGGEYDLPLPRVGGLATETVALQQMRTAVWVPEDYVMFESPDEDQFVGENRMTFEDAVAGRISPYLNEAELNEWIGGESAGIFDFPTEGRGYLFNSLGGADNLQFLWWNWMFITIGLSVVIVMVGWVLKRTPWDNKLSMLLLAALALAVFSLKYDNWVLQGIAAARWGLGALIAIWVIYGLPSPKHAESKPAEKVPVAAAASAEEPEGSDEPASDDADKPEQQEE